MSQASQKKCVACVAGAEPGGFGEIETMTSQIFVDAMVNLYVILKYGQFPGQLSMCHEVKGAVSRQSSSFCLVFPITRP